MMKELVGDDARDRQTIREIEVLSELQQNEEWMRRGYLHMMMKPANTGMVLLQPYGHRLSLVCGSVSSSIDDDVVHFRSHALASACFMT